MLYSFYRLGALTDSAADELRRDTQERLSVQIDGLDTEICFYVRTTERLIDEELARLRWLLSETFEPERFGESTLLSDCPEIVEFGPRPNFETAHSTTATKICHRIGLTKVIQLERAVRFGLSTKLGDQQRQNFLAPIIDQMTQIPFESTRTEQDFAPEVTVIPPQKIPVLKDGIDALRVFNKEHGCGWDDFDYQMLLDLFVRDLKRDPWDVELFQLAQANSEHSRHHTFKGRHRIDGVQRSRSLLDTILEPLRRNPANSKVTGDDSSAIAGAPVLAFAPALPDKPSQYVTRVRVHLPISSWETHNHPCLWEPFNGALTCLGGWLRDIFAIRNGGVYAFAGAGYALGNLKIPRHPLPWEEYDQWQNPPNTASPLDVGIKASNGMSQYGNEFGIPLIVGWLRTFGMKLLEGFRSWHKPIVYGGGVGRMDECQVERHPTKKGMLLVHIGGSGLPIGVGGGSGSSMAHGQNDEALDLNSVQRGDAFMENPVGHVVRICVELGEDNPIEFIVDLGAGGLSNACPEIALPNGAFIRLQDIPVGDTSMTVLVIWSNEAQERIVVLANPENFPLLQSICEREGAPCDVIGEIVDDGIITLYDEETGESYVQLPLEKILGDLPPKTFDFTSKPYEREPLVIPDMSLCAAIELVLTLPSVASKRWLTTKADRSVTGLIAQQQCVGPNHLPLADVAVTALGYFDLKGTACSLGEQPIVGLISPAAMARMAVAEALLNMAAVKITSLTDIKASGNWMLNVKGEGEGVRLHEAADALSNIMIELGSAIDGGKDSLSMATLSISPNGETQHASGPMQLVIAAYALVDDITRKVTPDLKMTGSCLIHVSLNPDKYRMGGTAFAQVINQLGDECPDIDNVSTLAKVFTAVQELINRKMILSYHDGFDGLAVTLLEMAFAGNKGIHVDLRSPVSAIETYLNGEPGFVIECDPSMVDQVVTHLQEHGLEPCDIGTTNDIHSVVLAHNGIEQVFHDMLQLRQTWESTSTALDRLQANPACVDEESRVIAELTAEPPLNLTYTPAPSGPRSVNPPKVAILREQGSNGEREMAAAFYMAGFDPWDVTMTDLLKGRISLDDFRGVVFVGGFSYGDILGSAKGWAGTILFNPMLKAMFDRFYARPDAFSLGVCNGCQIMSLLDWVPGFGLPTEKKVRFIRNTSERFESRPPLVGILDSPAIMLQGMAGSILPIWVAHGEGRLHVPDEATYADILSNNLAPMRFVDYEGSPTTTYPFNPNGSPEGITALCSPNGQHLAMMPHLERHSQLWNFPWFPREWHALEASPWVRPIQNAYDWCLHV